MSKLIESITADAHRRLTLPAGRHPVEEESRFRKFLKYETHRLKLAHRDGGSGREICRARAVMLDRVFCHLIQACANLERYQDASTLPPYALVAIGGYGRAELNPHSDVDILFLHPLPEAREDSPLPFLELMSRTPLMFDLFPKVGYSVRNIDDCVREANKDMRSQTSLLEARLICGDSDLFEKLQQVVQNKCIKGRENAYIAARIEDQARRRAKFGNTAFLQEPNVKNGCGGLRDYQNLIWMARFRRGCRSLAGLREQELITEEEERLLDRAYDYLLRVRNEIHYHLNRPVDKLSRDIQPAVARNLGYTDRSFARRIERFMSEYYRHARNIHLITRTVEQRLALLPQPRRLPTLKQFLHHRRKNATYVVDGFKFMNDEAHPASERTFEEQPERLMRIFRYAQQRGVALAPELTHLIRNSLSLVTPEFRANPHVHETFLEILRQRGSVAPILRAMHDTGLLGAFLPAFGRLTGKVQHEFFHLYTADEHTLVCLEKLDELEHDDDPSLAFYVDLFHQVERPELLYLALLLHDIGKGRRGADHTVAGSRMAASAARKLGLGKVCADQIRLLVRHHLLMFQTGLQRDLDAPAEIERFARLVENEENLKQLTLLTVADTRGTRADLWNDFKNGMLRKLFFRAQKQLNGDTLQLRADRSRRKILLREVRSMAPPHLRRDEIEAHFEKMPPQYFRARRAREIVADLELMHTFMVAQLQPETRALEPVLAWHDLPDRGFTRLKVCTWDHRGAFSQIAGALRAAGLDILSAEIFTREEGVLIDTFLVLEDATGELVRPETRAHCETILKNLVAERGDTLAFHRRQAPSRRSRLPALEPVATRVTFDNDAVPRRTAIVIEAQDRLGLLYTISRTLSDEGLDISVAKISSGLGVVQDTFYVRDVHGGKITDPARQRELATRLKQAIDALPL